MNAWAVEMLVATALLMALVLIVRTPVATAFGPRAAYALWALPALRAVLPSVPGWCGLDLCLPAASAAVAAVPSDPAAMALPAGDTIVASVAPVAQTAIDWWGLLLAVWLGGALLWFGWQMLRYHRFLVRALRSATLLTHECGIDVFVTPDVDGPVAAGVLNRRIFLPADFLSRYSRSERRLALLHEGAHHDRRDILANLAALAVLALHWWNPLAHRAYRAFRADQELACDATVLADVAAGDRHAYGSAVVKSVSARMPGVACALSHKEEIKRRLKAMAAPRLAARRVRAGAVVAIAATAAGLAATASGHAEARDTMVIDTATILSPAERDAIRAQAEAARAEGLRAAEEGRRAAEEGRRAAEEARAAARIDADRARQARIRAAAARAAAQAVADDARAAGLRAAAAARVEAERARREAQAGVEAASAARAAAFAGAAQAEADAHAARAAAVAGRAAYAEAGRAAAVANQTAPADAARAGRAAAAAARASIAARFAGPHGAEEAARQIAETRRMMAARCAARGKPVSPDLDWRTLALCGEAPVRVPAAFTIDVPEPRVRVRVGNVSSVDCRAEPPAKLSYT